MLGRASLSDIRNAFLNRSNGRLSGVLGGFGDAGRSIFGSLTKNDLSGLEFYNDLINRGYDSTDAFSIALENASKAARDLANGAKGGVVSLDGLTSGFKSSAMGALALRAGTIALNAALSMLATVAIQGIITGLDYLINKSQKAFDSYSEMANDAKQKASTSAEEVATLDELISKYQELKSSGNDDAQTRAQIREIQGQIVNLVGSEASGLDLVNGSLSQQLAILKQINQEKSKQNVQSQVASYHAAKNVSDNVVSDASYGPIKNHYVYVGSREKEAEKILHDAGYNNAVQVGGFNQLFVMDEFDESFKPLKTAAERVEFLNGMILTLESNLKGYASSDLYNALVQQRDNYTKYLNTTKEALQSAVGALIDYHSVYDSELVALQDDNVDSFIAYRNKLIDTLMNSEELFEAFSSGDLTKDMVEAYVSDFMAAMPQFQNAYKKYQRKMRENSIFDIFAGDQAENAKEQLKGFIESLSEEDLEIAYNLSIDPSSKSKTASELEQAIEDAKKIGVEKISFDEWLSGGVLNEAIEKYQKNVTGLKDTLKGFRNGSLTENDVIRAYPEMASSVGNMESALVSAILNANDAMADSFDNAAASIEDEGIPALEQYKQAVLEIGNISEELYTKDWINEQSAGMDNLINSIKSSVSELGLNSEQVTQLTSRYKNLDKFDPAKLFEKTENGIHLNTKALAELESAYEDQTRTGLNDYLKSLVDDYNDLTRQINETGDATGELGAKRNALAAQIDDVSALAAQYEGLTSSFNKWKQAQSMGEEGDMYDSVTSGLKDIKSLYKEGLIGTNKFRAAVQMMTNEDVSTKSADELVAIYDKAMPKMERYFKDGHDGVVNFLKDVNKLNSDWAHINDEGNWEIDFGVGSDKDIAEALGISTEGVQMVLRKLKDFGFEINLDSMYSDLGLAATNAEEALAEVNTKIAETQKALASGTGDTAQLESQLEQYENAKEILESITDTDASLDLDTMTLDEAIEKISALEQMMASGIELPITLAGQYDELMAFIEKIGAEQNIPIDIPLSTSGTGKEEVEQTGEAVDELGGKTAEPTINANDADIMAKMPVVHDELLNLDAETAEPTIGATDDATSIVDGVKEKLDETADGTYDATVSAHQEGADEAQTDIQGVADGDYSATISAQTDSTLETVSKALDDAAKARTATITTEYKEIPITGNEPDYVDNTHVNEDGVTVGYSGVLPYQTREPDKGKDREIVPPAQTWQNSPAPPSIGVDIEANDDAGQQIVEQVQDQVDSQPPIEWPSWEELEEMYPAEGFEERARKALEGESVEVPVEAENPEAIIEDIQQAASANPVQISTGEVSLDRTDMSKISSHIGELSNAAMTTGGAAKEVTELTNAYIALGNAQKEVSSVDVGDPAAVEAASSGLAEAAANFQTAYANLQDKLGDTSSVEVDAETETALSKIQALAETNPTTTATVDLDSSAVDSYQPSDKSAQANYSVNASAVNSWTPPTKHGTVVYSTGGAGAAGAAHARGTAFANGNWGTRESGVALGGELGQELVVFSSHIT